MTSVGKYSYRKSTPRFKPVWLTPFTSSPVVAETEFKAPTASSIHKSSLSECCAQDCSPIVHRPTALTRWETSNSWILLSAIGRMRPDWICFGVCDRSSTRCEFSASICKSPAYDVPTTGGVGLSSCWEYPYRFWLFHGMSLKFSSPGNDGKTGNPPHVVWIV